MKIVSIVMVILAACTGVGAYGSEPTVERFVYINRPSTEINSIESTGLGLIADMLVQHSQTSQDKATIKRYEFMKKTVTNFDIPKVVAEATRCMPISGDLRKCVDPIVQDGAGIVEQINPRQPGDVVEVISIFLDYNKQLAMKGGMVFYLTFDEMTFGSVTEPTHRYFQLMYWDPPAERMRGSPFGAATRANPGQGDLAAQRYWLEGSPSRFEISVRRALADFKGISEIYYAHAVDMDTDPTTSDWWKSLPTRSDLKRQGGVPCRGGECKWPYLRVDGDRLWTTQKTIPTRAVFQSVPLSLWNTN